VRKLTLIALVLVTLAANAEIKQVQVRVSDETPTSIMYQYKSGTSDQAQSPRGGFVLTNQSSNMVPVLNKRILGFRMPFIKGHAHDVLIVGPFLDMCNEVKILDEDDHVLATIPASSFTEKGKKSFFILRDDDFKTEGYIQFRLSASLINTIGRRHFKIKVGSVENLDIVEGKIVERYEAEAILFTGADAPVRTANPGGGIRTTLALNRDYTVKIKIRGGNLLATDEFQINNGVDRDFIYFTSECATCRKPFIEARGPVERARLLADNDAIQFTMRATANTSILRIHGELIAIADAGAGNWSTFTPEHKNTFAIGQGPTQFDRPDGWGPYLYLRESADIYRFGQYTDLRSLVLGTGETCACASTGVVSSGGATRPIGSTGGGNNNNAALPAFTITTRNVFQFRSSGSPTINDNFGTTANLCLNANDPNPKITTIPPLTFVIEARLAQNNLTVRISRGGTVLLNVPNVNIAAGATREIPYNRTESRVCVTRSLANASICKRCGDGVQGIAQWDDEEIKIEVLQGQTVLQSVTLPSL
jgi:hypothetical protein